MCVVEPDLAHRGPEAIDHPSTLPARPASSAPGPGTVPGVPMLSKEVHEAFRTLPSRYLGAEDGFDATYHVCLADVGHTWEVRCTPLGARVRMGATRRRPDVTIGTDARTWLQLRQGELSGLEAFSQRQIGRASCRERG